MKIVPIIIGIFFITHLREPVIPEKNRIEIEKYITPSTRGQKIIPQNSMPSHGNPEHSDWR